MRIDIIPEEVNEGTIVSAKEFYDKQVETIGSYPEEVQKKITLRSIEDLEKATCIFINNGDGMVCVTESGDIESVLKSNGSKLSNFLVTAFINAISLGGNKLDCYNCPGDDPKKAGSLGDKYCRCGFIPVCRIRFNRLYVDPAMVEAYGEPEVMFFIHCGDSPSECYTKIMNHEYPGINEYDCIPYIDEVQNEIGISADDTDYCFAQYYRDMIKKIWDKTDKEYFDNDFAEITEYLFNYIFMMDGNADLETILSDDEIKNKRRKDYFRQRYSYNENYELEFFHDIPINQNKCHLRKVMKNELPEIKYDYFFNNLLIRNPGIFLYSSGIIPDTIQSCNAYIINSTFYGVDKDKDGAVFLYLKKEKVEIIHKFSNPYISNYDILSLPIICYKNESLWFIDTNEEGKNVIFRYYIKDKSLSIIDIECMQKVFCTYPIFIEEGVYAYFYLKYGCLEDDFTIIKNVRGNNEYANRVGEIEAINERYVYCNYESSPYVLELSTMKKILLENKILALVGQSVYFIDASRDIVYIEESYDDVSDLIPKYMPDEDILSKFNFDTLTRGKTNDQINIDNDILSIPYNINCYERKEANTDFWGYDLEGVKVSFWKVPKILPDKKIYSSYFTGEVLGYVNMKECNDRKEYEKKGNLIFEST